MYTIITRNAIQAITLRLKISSREMVINLFVKNVRDSIKQAGNSVYENGINDNC
jgi:hypothetical protein